MSRWKTKLVAWLVIYFAGFATAIYCLAPVPGETESVTRQRSFVQSIFKSDSFAQSFNVRLHRCVDFAKDSAQHVAKYIKDKAQDEKDNINS